MAFKKLKIAPGIIKDSTPSELEGHWSDSNLIRFQSGLPRTVGGWLQISGSTYTGVCRSLRAFSDNSGSSYIAVGTHTNLYIYNGGNYYDITPIRATTTPAPTPFATVLNSATVTITDTTHGALVGDTVIISEASAVNGITLLGNYIVQTVPTSNTYTVTGPNIANNTGSGGGTPTIKYLLNIGLVNPAISTGWGTGVWSGAFGWDTPSAGSTTLALPRIWFMDNFGQTLLIAPRGGTLYKWDPTVDGTSGRATAVAGSPAIIEAGVIVNPQNRHVVCLGASYNTTPAPTQIIWSDQMDYTVWTPTATNLAGSLQGGGVSRIFGGQLGNNQIVAIGDTRIYGLNYIGSPYVFGLAPMDTVASLIATNAIASFNGMIAWMGTTNFYIYNGSQVLPIPCPVKDYVYTDLNTLYKDKIFAFANSAYNEIWWFYPSAASMGEPDKYVSYNTVEQVWAVGTLSRTAATSKSIFDFPILANPADSILYYHENGTTANGALIQASITSGPIDLQDGDTFATINRFIPDLQLTGGADLTITTRSFPNDVGTVNGPYAILPATQQLLPRVRGRSIQFQITSTDVGNPEKTSWRMGDLVVSYVPSGRR